MTETLVNAQLQENVECLKLLQEAGYGNAEGSLVQAVKELIQNKDKDTPEKIEFLDAVAALAASHARLAQLECNRNPKWDATHFAAKAEVRFVEALVGYKKMTVMDFLHDHGADLNHHH